MVSSPAPLRHPLRAVAAWALLLLAPVASRADGEHVFWEVAGRHNTVYLLGSVHVLHADDRALPPVTEAAYLDAETLVEELNLFTAAAELATAAAQAHQQLPGGQTLAGVLGPDLHRRLATTAAGVDLDAAQMSGMQPWYAALTLTQQRLAKAGYSADHGVDYQIALRAPRAQRDGKPIRGLETAVEQLAMLASMTPDEQVRFLEATLDESDTADEMRAIAAAWRRGDLAALDALIRQGAAESPGFFQRLITDRNLKWLPQIEAMLTDASGDDYLVVAGAAHMLGESGLVELLRRKGYAITRR